MTKKQSEKQKIGNTLSDCEIALIKTLRSIPKIKVFDKDSILCVPLGKPDLISTKSNVVAFSGLYNCENGVLRYALEELAKEKQTRGAKMNENEFVYDGKTYVAKETKKADKYTCRGCAFRWDARCPEHYGFPSCCPNSRKDKRDIVFVEKEEANERK